MLLLIPSSLAAGATSGEGFYPAHNEPANSGYAVGYLGWPEDATAGKIHWQKGFETEDPGGPSTDEMSSYSRGLNSYMGWHLRTLTGGQHGRDMLTTIEFESEPLPKKLYLNVSRVVQLDLFLTSGTTFSFDVRIYAGEKFLGGALPSHRPGDPAPATQSGWTLDRTRFFPELDVLEKGTSIRIEMTYDYAPSYQPDPAFGFRGSHQSVLQLPTYAPEEVLRRRPEFVQETSPGRSVAGPDSMFGLAAAGALPALRRRRWGLVIPLLLAPAFAGCFSRPAEPVSTDGPLAGVQDVRVLVDNESLLASKTHGAILGTVRDDLSFPVPSAFVVLLSNSRFVHTDGFGGFAFRNVTPETVAYRVDKEGYRSFEGVVEVKAGHVSKIELALEPLEKRTGGFRPHLHDLWPATGRKTLFEGAVNFGTPDEPTVCAHLATETNRFCLAPFLPAFDPEHPNLVLPGTARLDVTVDWEGGNGLVERVGLLARTNLAPCPRCPGPNWTVMYPRGDAETTHIMGAWELTDVGHQTFSVWEWALYVPMNDATNPNFMAQLVDATYRVRIEMHKGVVPVEPGHPDFWGKNETLTIVEPGAPLINDGWRPTHIVPPETSWLEIHQQMAESSENDLFVQLKTAKMPPGTPESEFRKLTPKQTTPKEKIYHYTLATGEEDGFYAKSSQWGFLLYNSGDAPPATKKDVARFWVIAHRNATVESGAT